MHHTPNNAPKPRGGSTLQLVRQLFARHASTAVRHARRTIIFVVGATVVLIGVIMIVTPGPALVVIPLGLGILAIEFAWARRLLRHLKDQPRNFFSRDSGRNGKQEDEASRD